MISSSEKKLQEKYLSSLPGKVENLQDRFQQKDITGLCSALHKLTGSAGMYGFNELSERARELNLALTASEGEEADIESVIDSIKFTDELNALLDAMRKTSLT